MFSKAAFPDLASSASAAMAMTKKDEKQAATAQPQLRNFLQGLSTRRGGPPPRAEAQRVALMRRWLPPRAGAR
eukprot:12811061-Alexandrium_andersonii.AAC.1